MNPRPPTPRSHAGAFVLLAALAAGAVVGVVWKRHGGPLGLESKGAAPGADARPQGNAGAQSHPDTQAQAPGMASLPGGPNPGPSPTVAPWMQPPAYDGADRSRFPVTLPGRVSYAADCDSLLPADARVTDLRSYLKDRGVDAGALLPEGGRLFSWTRYFKTREGTEASVAVRRVAPEAWVVRASVKRGAETKPGQTSSRAVRIPGYDDGPLDEARAREVALRAHAVLAGMAAEPLGRTTVLGVASDATGPRGGGGAGGAQETDESGAPRDLLEFRNGALLRATLHSDVAACEARGAELACECGAPFED